MLRRVLRGEKVLSRKDDPQGSLAFIESDVPTVSLDLEAGFDYIGATLRQRDSLLGLGLTINFWGARAPISALAGDVSPPRKHGQS